MKSLVAVAVAVVDKFVGSVVASLLVWAVVMVLTCSTK